MKLNLRFRPKYSLADLDPSTIEQALDSLKNVSVERVIDDRMASGTSVTAVIRLAGDRDLLHPALTNIMVRFNLLDLYVMDPSGNETRIDSVQADQLIRFNIENQ